MSEAQLNVAYIIRAGNMEATIDLARQRVRFVMRDELGLDRGTCEMALAQWSAIGDAMAAVAEKLKPVVDTVVNGIPCPSCGAAPCRCSAVAATDADDRAALADAENAERDE